MARLINGQVLTAFAAGMVGGLLAPLIWPTMARVARPAAKGALRAGLAALERGREVGAEWAEGASDLLAEVQAERAAELGDYGAAPSHDDEAVTSLAAQRPGGDREAHA